MKLRLIDPDQSLNLEAMESSSIRWRNRALPEHITFANWKAFEVKIRRGNELHYKSFPYSNEADQRRALSDAVCWRDSKLSKIEGPRNAIGSFRSKSQKSGMDDIPVGVSRSTYKAKGRDYLRYVVSWVDRNGIKRSRTFTAGSVDQISTESDERALETAKAFRKEWEFCSRFGLRFDHDKYGCWKIEALYPFLQPEISERLSTYSDHDFIENSIQDNLKEP